MGVPAGRAEQCRRAALGARYVGVFKPWSCLLLTSDAGSRADARNGRKDGTGVSGQGCPRKHLVASCDCSKCGRVESFHIWPQRGSQWILAECAGGGVQSFGLWDQRPVSSQLAMPPYSAIGSRTLGTKARAVSVRSSFQEDAIQPSYERRTGHTACSISLRCSAVRGRRGSFSSL